MIFVRGSLGMIATVTLSTALTDIRAEIMDVTAAAAQLVAMRLAVFVKTVVLSTMVEHAPILHARRRLRHTGDHESRLRELGGVLCLSNELVLSTMPAIMTTLVKFSTVRMGASDPGQGTSVLPHLRVFGRGFTDVTMSYRGVSHTSSLRHIAASRYYRTARCCVAPHDPASRWAASSPSPIALVRRLLFRAIPRAKALRAEPYSVAPRSS